MDKEGGGGGANFEFLTHSMLPAQFWTSIDLLGLPTGHNPVYSSIYEAGHILKTKIISGNCIWPN